MTTDRPEPVRRWHEIVRTRDLARLDALLADHVVFRSPAVHTPQEGRALTTAYLTAALDVLGPGLSYHREWYGPDSAVLEFTTTVEGKQVHGVDMMQWGADGRLVDFTVMARPAQGLTALISAMGARLASPAPRTG